MNLRAQLQDLRGLALGNRGFFRYGRVLSLVFRDFLLEHGDIVLRFDHIGMVARILGLQRDELRLQCLQLLIERFRILSGLRCLPCG